MTSSIRRYPSEESIRVSNDPQQVQRECERTMEAAGLDVVRGPTWAVVDPRRSARPCARFTEHQPYAFTMLRRPGARDNELLVFPLAKDDHPLVASSFRGFTDEGELIAEGLTGPVDGRHQELLEEIFELLQASQDVSVMYAYGHDGRHVRTYT